MVEQMIEIPTRFKAIPLEKGVESLLKRKTQDFEKLKQDSELLLASFNSKENAEEIQTVDSSFILVPKKETVVKRQIETVNETLETIDLVLSWNRFYHGIEIFDQHVKHAAERSVKIRYIVENPPTQELKEQALIAHENGSFKMRFVNEKPKAIFGIYDRRKLMILVDPLFDAPGASPSLWTNNRSLIALAQENFDNLWRRSKNP